ncbi:MAG: PDZ domain-containing protein, partial [Gammaproteobacteria bacterium]|nr:PDZ domain-containing protein [Gammaproteobacteria bacterium]
MRLFNVMLVCVLTAMSSVSSAQSDDAQFEAKLEAARARLDAAARELAELHGGMETHIKMLGGPGGNRAFLGILLGSTQGDGVALVGVTPGGGAEQAGLASGDVVTAINGVAVAGSARNITQALSTVAPGDEVVVDFLRGDRGALGQRDYAEARLARVDARYRHRSRRRCSTPWRRSAWNVSGGPRLT